MIGKWRVIIHLGYDLFTFIFQTNFLLEPKKGSIRNTFIENRTNRAIFSSI